MATSARGVELLSVGLGRVGFVTSMTAMTAMVAAAATE
jgi:hypothetical protein